MGSLLVIDDSRVRKEAFSSVRKIMRQIEKLESDLASFRDEDQKLFTHWSNVTFRFEREKIARGQSEFEYLCKFHNWMIAVARMEGVTIEEALLYLREEEERYDEGGPLERFAIDRARAEREEFLREEMRRDREEKIRDFEEDEDEDEEDDEFDIMHAMSDEELLDLCPTGEDACDLLARIFNYRRDERDLRLFVRLWNLLPEDFKDYVTEVHEEDGRTSFTEFLRKLMRKAGLAPKPDPEPAPEAHESLRHLYYKLVRQLHPDLQEMTEWNKKIWERVQQAYQAQNRFELEKLARLVALRVKNLNDLKISEILESQSWLKAELDGLRREARSHRRSPAWRFSQRKDFKPVIRKIKKTLDAELSYISECVRELKMELGLRERRASKRSARPF